MMSAIHSQVVTLLRAASSPASRTATLAVRASTLGGNGVFVTTDNVYSAGKVLTLYPGAAIAWRIQAH